MSSRTRRGARLITCALIAAGLFALASSREARPDSSRESAPGGQYDPALAFGATNTLAVWEDQRGGGGLSIFGGRVTHAGTVLDPDGIPIALAPNTQHRADVASFGANYLVTWADERSTGSQEIYAARVTGSGSVLDPSGIPLSTGGCCRHSPAVGFGSVNHLVAWSQSASGATDIRGTRVTTDGVVLDPAGFAIASASGWQWNAAVASDGTNHFVVWEDERTSTSEIYGTRVTPDGVVLDPQGIRISSGSPADFPAIAFDGVNYLVTWADSRAGIDVYGARVTPAGVVLDASGIPISTSAGTQTRPSVAFDGTNSMVVWEDYRAGSIPHVYAARVSPEGAVLDPAGIRSPGQFSSTSRTSPSARSTTSSPGRTGARTGRSTALA
jgi:large repetitive protein